MFGFAFTFPADVSDEPRLTVQAMHIGHIETVTEAEQIASDIIGSDELAYWPAGIYVVSIVDVETMEIALAVDIDLPEAIVDEGLLEAEETPEEEDPSK